MFGANGAIPHQAKARRQDSLRHPGKPALDARRKVFFEGGKSLQPLQSGADSLVCWITCTDLDLRSEGKKMLGKKQRRWLTRLQADYEADVLPLTEEICARWSHWMAVRTLPVIDGLIAATALAHHLTIATRNTADFEGTGVEVVNPFA